MKKWLFLIGAPAIVLAVIGVSIYDQIHYAQKKGYTVNCTHSSEPSATSDSLVCVSDSHQEYDGGKPYPPQWNLFLAWPEGITALLLLLTLGSVTWQGWHTRNSADAALRQANHIVASERAWLVLTSIHKENPGAVPTYWWRIKNVGSTPAKVIETKADCRLDMGFMALPNDPPYSIPVQLNGRLLAPGDYLDFHTFWSDSNGDLLMRAKFLSNDNLRVHLVAFGYVKYLTVMDSEVHESRFCDDCTYFGPPLPTPDKERYFFVPFLKAPPVIPSPHRNAATKNQIRTPPVLPSVVGFCGRSLGFLVFSSGLGCSLAAK